MKTILVLAVAISIQISVIAQTPSARSANEQSLPIKRVILYSNGVAHIERRGFVSGDAEINLSFKQSQIDDVLKSMIVLDLGEGRIGAVSYNSSAPPSARIAEIPFGIDASGGGIARVLSQLQGARVSVLTERGPVTGSVLTVEPRDVVVEKEKRTTHFLVIASQAGEISSFDLNEVRSVKLLDDDAASDINEFADATAQSRRRDAKTITVTSSGTGRREMMVSYTIAAPIWKTTYRVVLDDEGKPFFQGWAIIDNVSEEDWNGVQMSLVSGSPVSFIQNLQKPLFRYRPIVPIPEDLNLDPQIYEAETGEGYGEGYGTGRGYGVGDGVGEGRASGNGFTIDGASGSSNTMIVDGQEVSNFQTGQLSPSTLLNSGVDAAATGNEIGDLFEYAIDRPVTVQRNRSALIPIIQVNMEGERVSIYNESVRRDRPMGGMLLTNVTPLTFEGGSLTVLDGNAYAGEALMERLKPQEKRLISFALDLGSFVSVENKQDREPAKLIKAVDGVFEVHFFTTNQKIYHVSNQTNRKKVLWIEHPRRRDWELSEDVKPDILTDRYYRFRIELEPFEKKSLSVTERQALKESYQISSLTFSQVALFVERRYIDAATKAKLEALIALRGRILAIDGQLGDLERERGEIAQDQARIRENIEALSKTSEAKTLIARYIQKANDQETRLEELNAKRSELESQKRALNAELASGVRGFEFEQTN